MNVQISSRDTLMLAVPFVLCLFCTMFRLDELFCASRNKSPEKCGRPKRGADPSGNPIFTDPDGRIVEFTDRRKKPTRAACNLERVHED